MSREDRNRPARASATVGLAKVLQSEEEGLITGGADSINHQDRTRSLLTSRRHRRPEVVCEDEGPALLSKPPSQFDSESYAADVESLEALSEAIVGWQRVDQEATAPPEPAWAQAIVGQSSSMRRVREVIRLVADRSCTVLITGETGTGKEVVARALHMASNRANREMVAVNCAALPAGLLESELFGHVKGSFTGADSSRIGRFEQAHDGTILLDEIGEMPLELQAKVLRVLQEKEIHRVGGGASVRVNARVVAATNCDLRAQVRDRRFRQDLFYRLNVVQIHLDPLRERPEDVGLLAEHFVEKICRREGVELKQLGHGVIKHLASLEWPGNARELEHAVERAIADSPPSSIAIGGCS